MIKIFVFCNSCPDPGIGDWHRILAIGEDGRCVAQHICSSHKFIVQDLGLIGKSKHDEYDEMYGIDNWELIYVPNAKSGECIGLGKAYKRNQQLKEIKEGA